MWAYAAARCKERGNRDGEAPSISTSKNTSSAREREVARRAPGIPHATTTASANRETSNAERNDSLVTWDHDVRHTETTSVPRLICDIGTGVAGLGIVDGLCGGLEVIDCHTTYGTPF